MHKKCVFIGSANSALGKRLRLVAKQGDLGLTESTLAAWMEWAPASPVDATADRSTLLISATEFSSDAWRFVRVRLAEAGRFFVALLPSGAGTAETVDAIREGAYDAITSDDSTERWLGALNAAGDAELLWARLFGAPGAPASDGLIGRSPSLEHLRDMIARIGPTNATTLILGESGTGKERVAQALHSAYKGGKGPFIAINCTALPRDLLEGELFGATKGAFTGAIADRPGLVEQADGGTLFLDEIGDLDRALQPKLLRFLETRRARRLGAKSDYSVDVRIVAATNAELRARVAAGTFREDLYYRLADITLELAPLRERIEDVPLLSRHFMQAAAERHGRLVTSIEPALLERFQAWSWPGNIRELRSTVERLVLLANGPILHASAWSPPLPVSNLSAPAPLPSATPASSSDAAAPLNKRQRRELALRLLKESGGDQSWVAARLGIHPTTLYRWRMRDKPSFPS